MEENYFMDRNTFFWLVGILEGEGSFIKPIPSRPNDPAIQIEMTDEDIISKVSKLFKKKYCKIAPRKEHYKSSYRAESRGKKAVKLMKELYPHMGERRKSQIKEAITVYLKATL